MNTKEYDFLMKKFLFKGSFGVVYELRSVTHQNLIRLEEVYESKKVEKFNYLNKSVFVHLYILNFNIILRNFI